jgi:regulation of enolase protein 1 (concanavalin A-like superfamily)
MTTATVPGLPFPLASQGAPAVAHRLTEGPVLTLTAAAGTDLFTDPGGAHPPAETGRLAGVPPEGDFRLAARVRVGFGSTFDAGVLLVHADEEHWAKLCFEYSPQKRPTAVTVVTRGSSDDANAFEVDGDTLWLRITRTGRAWAFHASADGELWRLLRYFTLDEPAPGRTAVGFLSQSPPGAGCTAVFDRIAFASGAPEDLRDGS